MAVESQEQQQMPKHHKLFTRRAKHPVKFAIIDGIFAGGFVGLGQTDLINKIDSTANALTDFYIHTSAHPFITIPEMSSAFYTDAALTLGLSLIYFYSDLRLLSVVKEKARRGIKNLTHKHRRRQ